MDKKQYYTAGELAALFGIPKQSMLYYAKEGLLLPEFTAPNGYRYYAFPQYLTLEMILFLRRLNIPVAEIRDFIEHRSPARLLSLIRKRAEDCRQSIRRDTSLLDALTRYERRLEKLSSLTLDRVLLTELPSQRFFITPIPEGTQGGSAAIEARTTHVREVFAHSSVKDKCTGWIIGKSSFFAGEVRHSTSIVTEVPPPDVTSPFNLVREAGLYAVLHLKGNYFTRSAEALRMLEEFFRRNELVPAGDVYVFPVLDYYATSDVEEYINTICVAVADAPK